LRGGGRLGRRLAGGVRPRAAGDEGGRRLPDLRPRRGALARRGGTLRGIAGGEWTGPVPLQPRRRGPVRAAQPAAGPRGGQPVAAAERRGVPGGLRLVVYRGRAGRGPAVAVVAGRPLAAAAAAV